MSRRIARNPFDRFELDPTSDLAAITDVLRERAEEVTSDDERASIRAAWESLTLHPDMRLELALTAVPETRPPLGRRPRAPQLSTPDAGQPASSSPSLLDLVGLPPLRAELDRTLGPESEEERALWAPRLTSSR
jgi:hypothetical protein